MVGKSFAPRPLMRLLSMSLVMVFAVSSVAEDAEAQGQRFQFAAIGDTAYSMKGEAEFDRVVDAMNGEALEFVVHVGDFEADPRPYARRPEAISMPCVEESFQRVLAAFQRSAHPFILTPGDNDWTDCHLLKARKVDALAALARVRELFYPEGRSLGRKTMQVTSQSDDPGFAKFRENLAWTAHGVDFSTFHIVGSNNNLGRTPEMDAEHRERDAANVAWLKKAFANAKASNALGLVLVTQANPGFETQWTRSLVGRYFRLFPNAKAPKEIGTSGFTNFLDALNAEMQSYDKPTLFIHGDTHIFHVNKPLLSKKSKRFVANFTRVEVFGDPDSHWVRVTVDPSKPALFSIEAEIVPENVAG